MGWQESFANVFGPGLLGGTCFGDLCQVLRDNRVRVHPLRLTRLLSALQCSVMTSLHRRLEETRFASKWRHVEVSAPVFILGHWRSGTTHLHNLLTQDDRFAFPNLYQVLNPHTFLTTERINTRLTSFLLPDTRFGLDNIRLHWKIPYEDEFALAVACARSSYLSWVWPRSHKSYDRYLTMRSVSEEDVRIWRDSLMTFAKKLTFKYQKPLILKSPAHTCRVKLLLDLFPGARFVHVHRNPYTVFSSTRHLDVVALRGWTMQTTKSVDWDARIIRRYAEMYDAFFEEVPLIPSGQFHEIRFEDLEQDPIRVVRSIYEALQLPDFAVSETALREYVSSLSGYQKNTYPEVSDSLRVRIARKWQRCFQQWGYSS